MATTYTTKDGDTADSIAWAYYGTLGGRVVEQLLDANTGLADYGPLLPQGVVITLPDIAQVPAQTSVRLWD
ncbi:tail protein X [Paraburkholderia sp. BR10936]|uniref:tail protein X n=1 Tax=Paraburkholderia sp. BR10936 TaxID=3236993 RepID=UPI0034D22DFD